jgi:hypothetical protein
VLNRPVRSGLGKPASLTSKVSKPSGFAALSL